MAHSTATDEGTPQRQNDVRDMHDDHHGGTGRRDRETDLLVAVQRTIARPVTIRSARGLSHFGEHSLGWLAAGLLGAVADRERRGRWLAAAAGVAGAHAASIGIKRVVRRPRPSDERVAVHVGTPSRLSFPSSHAASTTAAAVLFAGLTGRNLVPVLVPPMLVSRLVLGVHYPTDVLAGAALGGAVGAGLRSSCGLRATGNPDATGNEATGNEATGSNAQS